MSRSHNRRAGDAQPEQKSIRQVVVERAWNDLKGSLTLFFFATTILSVYNGIRLQYFDVRDFYAYAGTVGPVTVVNDAAGVPGPGTIETVFHPGDRVGWTPSFCVNSGTGFTAVVSLVHVESAKIRTSVSSSTIRYPGTGYRCGPKFNWLPLPSQAPAGAYVIHREVTFREGAWPLHARFPDIAFSIPGEVIPPADLGGM